MILFLIPVVVFVICFVISEIESAKIKKLEKIKDNAPYYSNEYINAEVKTYKKEKVVKGMSITGFTALPVLIITLFILTGSRLGEKQELARLQARREILVYQCENQMYNNYTENGKFELVDQIRKYNETIESGRAGLQNPWISIFYKHIYNDLETIDNNILYGLTTQSK